MNNHSARVQFCVSKDVLKKLQSKSKSKSIDDYINTLIMKDIDRLT